MNMAETKIIYHLDDQDTPYLVKLAISADRVTLQDLKNVLNRPNYKYFFKSMDDDFGCVCLLMLRRCWNKVMQILLMLIVYAAPAMEPILKNSQVLEAVLSDWFLNSRPLYHTYFQVICCFLVTYGSLIESLFALTSVLNSNEVLLMWRQVS